MIVVVTVVVYETVSKARLKTSDNTGHRSDPKPGGESCEGRTKAKFKKA